jgi:hypothetical protein
LVIPLRLRWAPNPCRVRRSKSTFTFIKV